MSRYSGGMADLYTRHSRAAARAQKRLEAEERNAKTPPERTRRARRLAALSARITT